MLSESKDLQNNNNIQPFSISKFQCWIWLLGWARSSFFLSPLGSTFPFEEIADCRTSSWKRSVVLGEVTLSFPMHTTERSDNAERHSCCSLIGKLFLSLSVAGLFSGQIWIFTPPWDEKCSHRQQPSMGRQGLPLRKADVYFRSWSHWSTGLWGLELVLVIT